MAVDNLNLCVFCTLACLTCGGILTKRAIAYGQRSIAAEMRGESRAMFEASIESHRSERLATVLLFISWLPVTNCAWIADQKCDRMVERFADTQAVPAAQNLAGNTHEIGRDTQRVDYVSHLGDGTTVSWSSHGQHRGRTSITAQSTAAQMRGAGSGCREDWGTIADRTRSIPDGSRVIHGVHGIDTGNIQQF
jgi:hypothetical protein